MRDPDYFYFLLTNEDGRWGIRIRIRTTTGRYGDDRDLRRCFISCPLSIIRSTSVSSCSGMTQLLFLVRHFSSSFLIRWGINHNPMLYLSWFCVARYLFLSLFLIGTVDVTLTLTRGTTATDYVDYTRTNTFRNITYSSCVLVRRITRRRLHYFVVVVVDHFTIFLFRHSWFLRRVVCLLDYYRYQ